MESRPGLFKGVKLFRFKSGQIAFQISDAILVGQAQVENRVELLPGEQVRDSALSAGTASYEDINKDEGCAD